MEKSNWRAGEADIQDDLPTENDRRRYLVYQEVARMRREVILDFDEWWEQDKGKKK